MISEQAERLTLRAGDVLVRDAAPFELGFMPYRRDEKRYSPTQVRDEQGRWTDELAVAIEKEAESLPFTSSFNPGAVDAIMHPSLEAAQAAKTADGDGSAWLFPSGRALGLSEGASHE